MPRSVAFRSGRTPFAHPRPEMRAVVALRRLQHFRRFGIMSASRIWHRFAVLACGAVFLLIVVMPRTAEAYPWMIRHDHFACRTCHADPSGGELLNLYGRMQGYDLLR